MAQSAAERKAAQRAREKVALVVTVWLNATEAQTLTRCFETQNGEGDRVRFYKLALLTGAAFVANAGTPRGRKIKTIKDPADQA